MEFNAVRGWAWLRHAGHPHVRNPPSQSPWGQPCISSRVKGVSGRLIHDRISHFVSSLLFLFVQLLAVLTTHSASKLTR